MSLTSMAWAGKQSICHIPPGNPENFHTITVNDKAVAAHVANHGDFVGSCQENCEAVCSDGNACTIDVEADLDQCICAAEPRAPIDCSDGNTCTADSCDEFSGCVNDPEPNNGNVCDDDNSNTSGEYCDDGSCVACPCFTGDDLLANGAVSSCGDKNSDPDGRDVSYMFWEIGGGACSGEFCGSFTPEVLTCVISSTLTGYYVQEVTPQLDQNCRALISDYCKNPDPDLTSYSASVSAGDEMTPPPLFDN